MLVVLFANLVLNSSEPGGRPGTRSIRQIRGYRVSAGVLCDTGRGYLLSDGVSGLSAPACGRALSQHTGATLEPGGRAERTTFPRISPVRAIGPRTDRGPTCCLRPA